MFWRIQGTPIEEPVHCQSSRQEALRVSSNGWQIDSGNGFSESATEENGAVATGRASWRGGCRQRYVFPGVRGGERQRRRASEELAENSLRNPRLMLQLLWDQSHACTVCPGMAQKSLNCGIKGHFSKVCLKKTSQRGQMQLPKPPPFSLSIPRIRDFTSVKMLGAGGFGAVYLANYRPANFVATVKLVNVDRFRRHKQAAMDKVVASVIKNPFLVKYYSCFCVKEAYVTVMEYIPGLDLMRVVTREDYLDIDSCQIIMAQLILALEHLHLRGFLHRDIKVSK
ncbi:hypothetical protein MRX96_016764 [Rhipicephalus microplus]